jgi:hypothetical protein
VGGLISGKTGPKGPHKLSAEIVRRARELEELGLSLAAIVWVPNWSSMAVTWGGARK